MATFAVTAPFWAAASHRLKKSLRSRQVPLLALSAAFCFIIMMFNIPLPGGTTGHATGAVLIAVLLGPWAACLTVSVALIIQALIFGDGGITCIGANCLNMAVIMPFAGYAVYRLISGKSDPSSPRRWIGAAAGAYAGLNLSALGTAVICGIQPLLFRDAAGLPLYAPYPLSMAIPAVAAGHILFFGIVEAVITGLIVAYIQRTDLSLLSSAAPVQAGKEALA